MDLNVELHVLLRAFPLSEVLKKIIFEVSIFGDQSVAEELALDHLRNAASVVRAGEEHAVDIKSN